MGAILTYSKWYTCKQHELNFICICTMTGLEVNIVAVMTSATVTAFIACSGSPHTAFHSSNCFWPTLRITLDFLHTGLFWNVVGGQVSVHGIAQNVDKQGGSACMLYGMEAQSAGIRRSKQPYACD